MFKSKKFKSVLYCLKKFEQYRTKTIIVRGILTPRITENILVIIHFAFQIFKIFMSKQITF